MIMMPFPHMLPAVVFLLLLLFAQRGSSVAVTTSPSNDSLPDGTHNGSFLLANSQHPYPTPVTLAPLTADLETLNPGDFSVSPCPIFLFLLHFCSALSCPSPIRLAADIRPGPPDIPLRGQSGPGHLGQHCEHLVQGHCFIKLRSIRLLRLHQCQRDSFDCD